MTNKKTAVYDPNTEVWDFGNILLLSDETSKIITECRELLKSSTDLSTIMVISHTPRREE